MYQFIFDIITLPINWCYWLQDSFNWLVANNYIGDVVKALGVFITLGILSINIQMITDIIRKRGVT